MYKQRTPLKSLVFLIAVLPGLFFQTGCDKTLPPVAPVSGSVSLSLSGSIEGDPYIKEITFSDQNPVIDIEVNTSLSSVSIEIAQELQGLTISVNGNTLESGSSMDIDLDYGANVISVTATSSGGDPVNYTLNITRPEPPEPVLSDRAELLNLAPSTGILSPAFSSDVFEYSATVSNTTTSVILAVGWSSMASLEINGTTQTTTFAEIDLSEGDNAIELVVTAEDGITSNTYTLTITRLSEPDLTPPVISLTGNETIYLEYPETWTEPGALAADPEEGDLSAGIVISGSVDDTELGTYTLDYDVTDTSGNVAETVSRTVIVQDTTAPVITLIGGNPFGVAYNGTWTDPGATLSDNYDADTIIYGTGSVDTSTAGDYTVTYSAADTNGNAAVPVERTVTVEAVDPVELPHLYYFWEDTGYMHQYMTGTDFTVELTDSTVVDYGTYIEWDNEANSALAYSDVVEQYFAAEWTDPAADQISLSYSEGFADIEDARAAPVDAMTLTAYTSASAVPPVIELNGDAEMTLTEGESFTDPGAVVYDWGSADESTEASDLDGLDTREPAPGTYTLVYTADTDTDGNAAAAVTRTVTVIPVPEMSEFYFFEAEYNQCYIGFSLTGSEWDVYSQDFPGEPVDNGTLIEFDNDDNSMIIYSSNNGSDYIKMEWTDPVSGAVTVNQYSGNATLEEARAASEGASVYEAYIDEAAVPPVLFLNGDDPMALAVDDTFVDPGALVKDWGTADTTVSASDLGGLDTSASGTYTLTYTSTDADGNSADPVTRTVAVGSGVVEIIIQ